MIDLAPSPNEAILKARTCKGVYYKARHHNYLSNDKFKISTGMSITLLKRRSCQGCDSPDIKHWDGRTHITCQSIIIDDLNELILDEDEPTLTAIYNLVHLQVYEPYYYDDGDGEYHIEFRKTK